jgi:hypothetical protein
MANFVDDVGPKVRQAILEQLNDEDVVKNLSLQALTQPCRGWC